MTNGKLFGNSPYTCTSTKSPTPTKLALETGEKIKLTFVSKQNGPAFLPRSLELNGKKGPFVDNGTRVPRAPCG